MEWLIPTLGGISGAIALYLSRPEKPRWALVTLCLILIAAGWQSAIQYSQEQTTDALNDRTYRDLESSVSTFLRAIAYLNVAANNGTLPITEDDFFSERTADTICNHINIEGKAMSLPPMQWWQFSGIEAEKFSRQVSSILTERAIPLSPEVVKILSKQENSLLLTYLTIHRKVDRKYLPNSFCGGVHAGVAESLRDLHDLYVVIKRSAKNSGRPIEEPWKYIGRRDLFGLPGRDRI